MTRIVKYLIVLTLLFALSAGTQAKTTVTMLMDGQANWKDPFDETLDLFHEKHPDIEVDIVWVAGGWQQVGERIIAMTLAGTPPDVLRIVAEQVDMMANAGMIGPIDDLVERDGVSMDDYFPVAVQMFSRDGKLLGIPWSVNALTLHYNIPLFGEAGVETPTEEWEWADLLSAAQKLTRRNNADGSVSVYGFQLPPPGPFGVFPWIYQNGGRPLSADQRRSLLHEPAAYEAIQWLADLRWVHGVAPVQGEPHNFQNQMTAIFPHGRSALRGFLSVDGLEFGVQMLPKGRKGRATMMGGGMFTVHPQSDDRDAAWEFVKFLAGPEHQLLIASRQITTPTLRSAATSPEYVDIPLGAHYYIEQLAYAHPAPSPINFQDFQRVFQRQLNAALNNTISARQAMEQATDELDVILSRD